MPLLRIGGQSIRLDRHACRNMDDSANPSIFRDGEIAARIIPCYHPSSLSLLPSADSSKRDRAPGVALFDSPMPSSVISTMMASLSSARRSEIMAAVRSKDTRPEIAVRRYLRATGPGYHLRQVPVSPERRIDGHDR